MAGDRPLEPSPPVVASPAAGEAEGVVLPVGDLADCTGVRAAATAAHRRPSTGAACGASPSSAGIDAEELARALHLPTEQVALVVRRRGWGQERLSLEALADVLDELNR